MLHCCSSLAWERVYYAAELESRMANLSENVFYVEVAASADKTLYHQTRCLVGTKAGERLDLPKHLIGSTPYPPAPHAGAENGF